MYRRSLGNGRRLAIVGALLVLVGCVLPWYTLGGEGGLPRVSFGAFDGAGVLAFLAAIATLAVVTLPYAAGERPVGIDRGIVYGLLAIAALAGLLLWVPNVLGEPLGMLPDRAPGFWLAVVGAVVLARGAFEVATEPPRR